MSRLPRAAAVLAALALLPFPAGCSKKPPEPPPEEAADEPEVPEDLSADREKWLASLKKPRTKQMDVAVENLARAAGHDPDVIPALLELLKDPTTAGSGETAAGQLSSTREAAAEALRRAGPKGLAALEEKGVPVLIDGLKDADGAIREHTAHTLGRLGAAAKKATPALIALCADPNPNVQSAALDAVRDIGPSPADSVALVRLLGHSDAAVRRMAADFAQQMSEVPDDLVPVLITAVGDEAEPVRLAAAELLANAGPDAAGRAVPGLVAALKKAFPPTEPEGPDAADALPRRVPFGRALVVAGGPAVGPLTELLTYPNYQLRMLAAAALGDIGAAAKPAADPLRQALREGRAEVPLEAARALLLIGEHTADALDLIRRTMDHPDPKTAEAAINLVPRTGEPTRSLVPAALAKMAADDPDVRIAAVRVFVGLGPKDPDAAKAQPDLVKLLSDEAAEVRLAVGEAVAMMGPDAAVLAADVGRALGKEKNDAVRAQYLDTLATLGPAAKAAIGGLAAIVDGKVEDASSSERVRAAEVAVAVDPQSKELADALLVAVGSDDVAVRQAAVTAIGRLDPPPPQALARLMRVATGDKMLGARLRALRALAEAGPKATPVKADLEALVGHKNPEIALLAKVALARMAGTPEAAAPEVRAALAGGPGLVRAAAVEALPLVGPPHPDDLPLLTKMLSDPQFAIRAGAARAVSRLGADAAPVVSKLGDMLNDRDSDVRLAAAESLGALGPVAKPAVPKLRAAASDPLLTRAVYVAINKITPPDPAKPKPKSKPRSKKPKAG